MQGKQIMSSGFSLHNYLNSRLRDPAMKDSCKKEEQYRKQTRLRALRSFAFFLNQINVLFVSSILPIYDYLH